MKNKLKINTGVIKVLHEKVTFDERLKSGRKPWWARGLGSDASAGMEWSRPGCPRRRKDERREWGM